MINIDIKSNKPIYEQIITEIKQNVIRGYLKAGDELPSVRKLALELAVTPNTVSKAYQELERTKVIETIRGKGTYIAENMENKVEDIEKMEKIKKEIRIQILELIYMGYDKNRIKEIIDDIYDSLK